MKKLSSIICTALLCVSALPALAAATADDHAERGGGKHRSPPAEAIEACKGLSAKDICQFNGRNNELVSGVCDTPRTSKTDEAATLMCRPNRDSRDKPPADDAPSN